ncbi:MAG: hypothetical protein P8J87_02185 [Verrucomicrobiales bacterium]|nr:hypothetical protein [Verrucomicrobiales bacterium]
MSSDDLDALATVTRDELDSGWEALRIRALLAACDDWVGSADGLPLRVFVEDLYQISGEHNHELPAELRLSLHAPNFLVLRASVRW